MKSKIVETQLTSADSKELLKVAAELRDKPQGFGKIFKGLQKDKVSINDLQQAWKDQGFGDDERDIVLILKKFGYGQDEIKKVFQKVFGEQGQPDEDNDADKPAAAAIQKFADYAKKSGMVDDLKAFMQQEFGEELGLDQPQQGMAGKAKNMFKKMTTEEIRQVFTDIIQEQRTDRSKLIREQEQSSLGRNSKSRMQFEDIDLHDALKANQYVKLLHSLKVKADARIEVSTIKNKIIQSWKQGMKSRKHYDDLLHQVHLSLNDLIDK